MSSRAIRTGNASVEEGGSQSPGGGPGTRRRVQESAHPSHSQVQYSTGLGYYVLRYVISQDVVGYDTALILIRPLSPIYSDHV